LRLIKSVDEILAAVNSDIIPLLLVDLVITSSNVRERLRELALRLFYESYQAHNVNRRITALPPAQIIGLLYRTGKIPWTEVLRVIHMILTSSPFERREILVLHALTYGLGATECTSRMEAIVLHECIRQPLEDVIQSFTPPHISVIDWILFWPILENSGRILMQWMVTGLVFL